MIYKFGRQAANGHVDEADIPWPAAANGPYAPATQVNGRPSSHVSSGAGR